MNTAIVTLATDIEGQILYKDDRGSFRFNIMSDASATAKILALRARNPLHLDDTRRAFAVSHVIRAR
jgi:hypothetical protein